MCVTHNSYSCRREQVTQSLTKKNNNKDHGTKKRRVDQDTDKSPAIIEESTKKSRSELRKLTQDDDEEVSSSHHHPKDMFDKDDSDNSHVAANNDAAREEESIPRPELPVVQEQPHHVLTDSKVPVAPVSMINAPPPRWGHTMTSIDDGSKLLVYGGQTLNEAGVPTTHGDLYVYDIHRSDFSKPIHCEGVERQWHSTVYLAQRQLLIAFGGEAPDRNNKGKITTLNQVMVLDTEIMLWYVSYGLSTLLRFQRSMGQPLLNLHCLSHSLNLFLFIVVPMTGTLPQCLVKSPLVVRVTPHPSCRTN